MYVLLNIFVYIVLEIQYYLQCKYINNYFKI